MEHNIWSVEKSFKTNEESKNLDTATENFKLYMERAKHLGINPRRIPDFARANAPTNAHQS